MVRRLIRAEALSQENQVLFYKVIADILDENPSKENIGSVSSAYAKTKTMIPRKEGLAAIDILYAAEARNSRGVGKRIESLIAVAEENIRRQIRTAI